jgi:hypothetical protein
MQTEDYYKQLGLKVASNLGDELQNVRKAATAILDADQLRMSVASFGHKLAKTKEFLNTDVRGRHIAIGWFRVGHDYGSAYRTTNPMEQVPPVMSWLTCRPGANAKITPKKPT